MSIEKFIILEKFLVLSPNIIDLQMLEKYVDFCLENRQLKKLINQTTSHHILPKAKTLPFLEWSNLNIHHWNNAELLYSDHYKAHYLLMKAVNHISTYHAFAAMHKKDFVIGRIHENDLISDSEFNEIWAKRNEKVRQWRLEKILVDDKIMTRAAYYSKSRILSTNTIEGFSKRILGNNNPVNIPGVVDKIRNTKANTFINGKNLDTISAEKAATTMKKEKIDIHGNITTIYKENGKKISKKLHQIEENGKTQAYNRNKVTHEKLRQHGNWYKVFNIFDASYCKILPAAEVRNISPGLEKCSKENYLGKTKFGITVLNKKNKSHLIGLFVEKLE